MCSGEPLLSEMRDQFQKPLFKKLPITRAHRLEQFLWHQFYEEYKIKRAQEILNSIPSGPVSSEYQEEYCEAATEPSEKTQICRCKEENLIKKYPLMGTALTFYNPGIKRSHARVSTITVPVQYQDGKFG